MGAVGGQGRELWTRDCQTWAMSLQDETLWRWDAKWGDESGFLWRPGDGLGPLECFLNSER